MFNARRPSLDELPSTAQLLRSTTIAAVSALVILFTVVLPAEYAIDPTGAGRVLGLTDMGKTKQRLEAEAEADRLLESGQAAVTGTVEVADDVAVGTAATSEEWSDIVTFTLDPDRSIEIKLVMSEGDSAEYAWTAEGGRINYDLHAHGDDVSADYEQGRGETDGAGVINAGFAGQHGWFWRNRDSAPITVTLRLRGAYSEVVGVP